MFLEITRRFGDIMNEKLYGEYEAAVYCGLDPAYFRNLRKTGHGPTFVRPSPHVALYRQSDLDAWKASWLTFESRISSPTISQ